ncbi:MAG: nucleoside transporter C-terminal domain-containing protein [Vulcanimicrobiota bacterium]
MFDFVASWVAGVLLNNPRFAAQAGGISPLLIYKIILLAASTFMIAHIVKKMKSGEEGETALPSAEKEDKEAEKKKEYEAEKKKEYEAKSQEAGGKPNMLANYGIGFVVSLVVIFAFNYLGDRFQASIPFDRLDLSLIIGYVFYPIAWIIGIPAQDCLVIGSLLGKRMVINEFVTYAELAAMLKSGVQLEPRSVMMVTYAMCGFANFSSIAIQIGGIGGMAPSRRSDLAKIGFHALMAGTLATFMSATIAGMIATKPSLKIPERIEDKPPITEEAPESYRNVNFMEFAAKQAGKEINVNSRQDCREISYSDSYNKLVHNCNEHYKMKIQ